MKKIFNYFFVAFIVTCLMCNVNALYEISLNWDSPENESEVTTNYIPAYFSVIGCAETFSCTLYEDANDIGSNISVLNNTNTYLNSDNLTDDIYSVTLNCSHNASVFTNTGILYIEIDNEDNPLNISLAVSFLNYALDGFAGVAAHLLDFIISWLPILVLGLVIKFYKQIMSIIGSWIGSIF